MGSRAKKWKKLNDLNIKTVLDLVASNANEIKKRFSVVMARTVLELQESPAFQSSLVLLISSRLSHRGPLGKELPT
jgi:hypothetical protein